MAEGLSNVQLTYVDDVESASRLMAWLGERRPTETLGIDLETGELPGRPKDEALSPWRGRIRLAQIGDGMNGWAIPWERWGGVFLEAMNKFEGRFLIHNAQFDTKWLELQSELDVPWHRIDDSMIAARICNPTEPAGLKFVTAKHVDGMAKYLQQQLNIKMTDNGWTWGTVPLELQEYHLYGALDPVLACRAWDEYLPLVGEGGKYRAPYELEMGVLRVATKMEINGARVDVDYSQDQYNALSVYGQSIRDWAKDHYGLNIASPKQMAQWFTDNRVEITERTAGGALKVDKTQLEKISVEHKGYIAGDMATQILLMRQSEKLAGSYFKNFIEMNDNGIVHPSINTLAARTSRMSITNPALQTLPKNNDIVRKAFIPRDPANEVLMSCDLEQVEARMFACFSGDKGLIDLFNKCDSTGEDFFTELGKEIYSDPSFKKSDKRRGLIKGCVPLTSQILTRRGWLNYDEVVEGDYTLGYNLTTGTSEWTRIEGVHVYDESDVYEFGNGEKNKTFYCTDDHRWATDSGRANRHYDENGGRKIEHAYNLVRKDRRVVLAAQAPDGTSGVTDEEAAFIGWILSDGSLSRSEFTGAPSQAGGSRRGVSATISQVKPENLGEIEILVSSLFADSYTKDVSKSGQHFWRISQPAAREFFDRIGIESKHEFDGWELALSLTHSARVAMLEALSRGDGVSSLRVGVIQESGAAVEELVRALAYLTGHFASTTYKDPSQSTWQKKEASVVWATKGRMTGQRTYLKKVSEERVWCVTTGLGTWTMRQPHNKAAVLTGNTIYGRAYGAGVTTMAETAKVPEAQMQTVNDSFDRKFPGMKKMMKDVEAVGARRLREEGEAYIITKGGRRLPAESDRLYALVNFLLQGSAAEVLKMNIMKMDAAGLTDMMIVPVHDEILLSVPKADQIEVAKTVQECMTTREGWEVPLLAGAPDVGDRWGELVPIY